MRIVRDRREIIEDILKAAQDGQIRTHIMYKTMLNFNQIKKYLLFLHERDLVLHDSATQLYTTTNKGIEFIKKSTDLAKLINN